MTEKRLHPFAALRVLRKTLVLYLVPLSMSCSNATGRLCGRLCGRMPCCFCWRAG